MQVELQQMNKIKIINHLIIASSYLSQTLLSTQKNLYKSESTIHIYPVYSHSIHHSDLQQILLVKREVKLNASLQYVCSTPRKIPS